MTNAVALLVGILPLYVIRFSIFGIPTTLFEVAVWATAITSICIPRTRRQLWSAAGTIHRKTFVLIALFLFSAIISTAISSEVRNSMGILKGWVITPLVFGFLVRGAAGKKAEIIRSLIISGFVVALFGFSQINGFKRIYSLYDVPNSLALFLVPIAVIAIWIGIKKNDRFYQYAAIVMLVAIIATQSLGAIIALIGTMVIAVPLSRSGRGHLPALSGSGVRGASRDRIPLIRALHKGKANLLPEREKGARFFWFLLIAITAAAFFTLSGRFAYLISPLTHPNTANSVTVRLQLWDIGFNLIKKHPILGIGLGQFEPAYQAELHHRFAAQEKTYNLQHTTENLIPEFVFRDPHNWIISFWLNTGFLGLVSFILLNYIAIRGFTLSERSESKGEGNALHRQAIALAIISMLIFGLFDTIYWKNDLSALWWLLILW